MQRTDGLHAGQSTDLNEEARAIVAEAFPSVVEAFDPILTEKHAPGLALGVVINGELAHLHTTGFANLEAGQPVRPDTVFRIASMTKSFAALAILQLRDAGKLQLDAPAAVYVPELAGLVYPSADSPPITVRHLLSMAAGLPQDDPWADRQLYRDDAWLSDFLRGPLSWSNPPGMTFEYSNLGYKILGRVIANVAQQGAMAYITDHILNPLGMDKTVWNSTDVTEERLAYGYAWLDEAHHLVDLLPCRNDGAVFAGLFTTLGDLTRWISLFTDAWRPQDEAEPVVLSHSSLREMQRIWSPIPPGVQHADLGVCPVQELNGYGFGLAVNRSPRHHIIGHGGGLPGFGSDMCWSAEHRLGVIAFANVTYAGVGRVSRPVLTRLIDALHTHQPRKAVPVTQTLADARAGVNHLLTGWDDSLADRLFADNFFLDLDRTHWQDRLTALRERHGALRERGELKAENWLRGKWRMEGERGWFTVWLSLAPTQPPRIQALEITSALPPTEAVAATMAELVRLIAHPTRRELDRLRAPDSDRDGIWRQVQLAHLLLGTGTVGALRGGDGVSEVCFRLPGERGTGEIQLWCNERGKIRALKITAA